MPRKYFLSISPQPPIDSIPDLVSTVAIFWSANNSPGVLRKRRTWFEAQPDLDPEGLVFIDESEPSRRHRSSATANDRDQHRAQPWPLPPGRTAAHGPPARPTEDDDADRWSPVRRHGRVMVLDDPSTATGSKARGAELRSRPPYSPYFNSIELAFAKLPSTEKCSDETSRRTFDWSRSGVAAPKAFCWRAIPGAGRRP